MSTTKSIVLLSAGLDSTVNLFLAHKKTLVTKTVTFNYGQRAASKELEQSKKISEYLKIPHIVIDLPWLKNMGESSLTNSQLSIPTGSEVEIESHQVSTQTAKSVWVPNRNGVFLNIAAALAEAEKVEQIIPGFNLEEAATFPDNSESYIEAANEAFKFSTSNHIKVVSYTIKMQKKEIMSIALREKIPLELMWPCYFSGDQWCGKCESCLRTQRALVQNNIDTKKYFVR